ncbi:MAG: cytochrome c oxidase subunit 3 [Saccharospirillum sp.]
MKWLDGITAKPWLPQTAGMVAPTAFTPVPILALRVLMGIITVFFLLIMVTFIVRSQYADFQALAGEPWQPFTDTGRLWLNTGVLLMASIGMELAVRQQGKGRSVPMMMLLSAGAFLAVCFLLLQVAVWRYLLSLGYGVSDNPANSYFYLFTGLHALHLLGGLLALARVFYRLFRGVSADRVLIAVKACAIYWHYLFILWLVLFFFLTRTPETYAFIAAVCGLG